MSKPRQVATIVHRWAGLTLALFLTIVGLTGAIIAWNDQLERVFAPSMFVLPQSASTKRPIDPFALHEAAERVVPGYAINGVDLTGNVDKPVIFYVEARPDGPQPHIDEIALNPFTAALLGSRRHGDLREGSINLMPFIYDLHDSLALGGPGIVLLGIIALIWTIDCFVGAYLTFPARAKERRSPHNWLKRWKPAWQVRVRASRFKLFYDLHRAIGLWPWALMAIIAWSSVSFNLDQVYHSVMAATLGMEPVQPDQPAKKPGEPPRLDWRQAYQASQREMAVIATEKGFAVKSERLMFYDPTSHTYTYRVLSTRDLGETGNTQILLNGDTGALAGLSIPTGEYAGTTVTSWIGDIHVGDVMGIPMRIALSSTGIAIAVLSVTGVWLWLRKRSGRARMRYRARFNRSRVSSKERTVRA